MRCLVRPSPHLFVFVILPFFSPPLFFCSARGRLFDKNEAPVNFPLQGLDMTPHIASELQAAAAEGREPVPAIFDCVAVVNHSGSSFGE